MHLYTLILLVLIFVNIIDCDIKKNVFDEGLYAEALNPLLCDAQLRYLQTSGLILEFYDAGVRIPRGILTGNLADWGNYHQCLAIHQQVPGSLVGQLIPAVEGKYCSISVPLQQEDVDLPTLPTWMGNVTNAVIPKKITANSINNYNNLKRQLQIMMNMDEGSLRLNAESLASLSFTLGICIPKTCSSQQTIDFILDGQNLNYTDNYCRLPNDKPFSYADYVAIPLFSIIGLLMILSTSYDLWNKLYLKKGPTESNPLYCSFSVYTNTKLLLTFNSSPNALHCIDGIRAISMLWVILGHKFSLNGIIAQNIIESIQWVSYFSSVWLMSSPIAVDTFIMMSGLLVAYTTVGKVSRSKFLKNIHLFYILRYLRLFPLVAAAVLLQASVIHHMSDGPVWHGMAEAVTNCQQFWWSTLLYVQNFVNEGRTCISPTWYLSVDMQLYWISPLVLVWTLGSRRRDAWLALMIGLIVSMSATAIYCFINNFQPGSLHPLQRGNAGNYYTHYYVNTMTRSPPFFVGMLFGYILHINRGKKVTLAPMLVFLFWAFSALASSFAIFITYPISQEDYDNQLLNNIINSFMRPCWAAALGWCIFACAHGYGGIINWFLSLSIWRLPARLSFAMYLLHFPLMLLGAFSSVRPLYFSTAATVYPYLSDVVLTMLVSYIMTLAFDTPFSIIQKRFIGAGLKSRPSPSTNVTPMTKEDAPKAGL